MVKLFVTIVSFRENSFNRYSMILIEHLPQTRTVEDTAVNTENRALPSSRQLSSGVRPMLNSINEQSM